MSSGLLKINFAYFLTRIFWLLISELWVHRAVLRVKWPHLKNGIWWTLSLLLAAWSAGTNFHSVWDSLTRQAGGPGMRGWRGGQRRTCGVQSVSVATQQAYRVTGERDLLKAVRVWMKSPGRPRTTAETLPAHILGEWMPRPRNRKKRPSHEVGGRRIRTVCQVTRGSAGKEYQILREDKYNQMAIHELMLNLNSGFSEITGQKTKRRIWNESGLVKRNNGCIQLVQFRIKNFFFYWSKQLSARHWGYISGYFG